MGLTPEAFECPRCHSNTCEVFALPKVILIHWVVNPAIAIYEILLGQRIPRKTLICTQCEQPWARGRYLSCGHCGAYHSASLWDGGNAMGHWFGLFCPDCGCRIPVLHNVLSAVIEAVTFPVWFVVWQVVKTRWIALERRRALSRRTPEIADGIPWPSWVLTGLGWGLIVWALLGLWVWLAFGSSKQVLLFVAATLPAALVGGALCGSIAKKVAIRRRRHGPGHCRACGYYLFGLPDNTCPECGFEFGEDDRPAGVEGLA